MADDNNPFKDLVAFNGLEINEKKHETPNAFVEIWGENDSLSADYDGYLTDGEYDKLLNSPKIKDYSVMVYFDFNSPSLTQLSPGKYIFENSTERKPNVFNSTSHIRLISDNKTELLKITSGTVQIDISKGYILVEYELLINNELPVKGQYTGLIELKIPY